MKYEFTSSITRGGSAIYPEKIIITDKQVTWQRRNKMFIGVDSITIPKNMIASVEINHKVWGADIFIMSVGSSRIVGKNFNENDAKKIRDLLQ
jgi:hypothetical protein